jgi:hypothetical protein
MLTEVSLSVIAAFSSSGVVFRAFGHLLAAADGTLLAVPVVASAGDLRRVVDGCPVPWEEVWAVVDAPLEADASLLAPDQLVRRFPGLAALARSGWVVDRVPAFAAGRRVATRVSHPCGIRFAKV